MKSYPSFEIQEGESPFVATAIHDGHRLRDNLMPYMNLKSSERLREEDPFTGNWIDIADTWVKGLDSRFEVDLNRPRDKAIYLKPEDAWGLNVWKQELPQPLIDESLLKYDLFYKEMEILFKKKIEKWGGVIVLDLHSYNHRRNGSYALPADPISNPEINIGTGNMNRKKWAPVVDTFIGNLRSFDYDNRNLDVRENVKFQGGHFLRWIHSTFPDVSCVLAIEVKKFFMDEHAGIPDNKQLVLIKEALKSALPETMDEFNKII